MKERSSHLGKESEIPLEGGSVAAINQAAAGLTVNSSAYILT